MLDYIATQNTLISRWGTKSKFISFVLLIFSFACIKSLTLLPVILLITGILLYLSRVPVRFVLQRLKIPALFIIVMALILLFFTRGQAIAQLGPLMVTQEGTVSALLMIGRFVSILTLIIVLFSTSTFLEILAVMQSLGIPEILLDMLMFTHRYLYELAGMFQQMNTAMVLRGFEGHRIQAVYAYSYLAGTIFIRSYEQSQRIYQAMVMRGYGQIPVKRPFTEAEHEDYVLSGLCIILALALGSTQFYLLFPGV